MLRVCNLTQTISGKTLLHNVSCIFDMGKIVALLGPNGAGKTTLLKTVMGFVDNPVPTEDQNEIFWDGKLINALPPHSRVELGIAYLPQISALFYDLSVQKNLRIIFECHSFWRGRTLEEFECQLDHWLEQTHLVHAKNQLAGSLSGGQKRKLEIVRSILMHPRLLICDEPFAGVDPKSIYELKHFFSTLAQEGIGVVISDHHVDQLLSIATYVYVILQGAVVASGTAHEILGDAHTQEHYLGYQFHKEMSEKFSE